MSLINYLKRGGKLLSIPFNNELFLYTGSTFDGCIVIKDVHGEPFIMSDGDHILFCIKRAGEKTSVNAVQIMINWEDEIEGEYPFKLPPEMTAELNGAYYYYAFIEFADGDKYQIVPHTPLKAHVPYGTLSYCECKNRIIAQVPRAMTESDYTHGLNELNEFIASVDSTENIIPVRVCHINDADIVLIGDIDTQTMTPMELIDRINEKLQYVYAENPYISGFFHADEIPSQEAYLSAVRLAFGEKFIDVESILKTPVYSDTSESIVSSAALDILKQKPSNSDLLSIIHNEYPGRMMEDTTHFNKKGCYAAARVLLKEVFYG